MSSIAWACDLSAGDNDKQATGAHGSHLSSCGEFQRRDRVNNNNNSDDEDNDGGGGRGPSLKKDLHCTHTQTHKYAHTDTTTQKVK